MKSNMDNYKTLQSKELHDIFADWSFSKEMQNISRNEMWKNKTGLWMFLSAACDDAASKCYQYINKFAQNLADIDTCNIHALKSIAESVDLGYLCNHIHEDYPNDILDLINILSIPKHYFIDSESFIVRDSSDLIFGEISQRAAGIIPETVTLNLLKDIKSNIIHIKNIFNMNLIFCSRTLKRSLHTDLKDLKLDEENDILNITVNEIISNIDSIKNEELADYQNQSLYADEESGKINYFYLLINVIKQNVYNREFNFFINTGYIDKDSNIPVDLRWLFGAIVNTISSNNKYYIKDFIRLLVN